MALVKCKKCGNPTGCNKIFICSKCEEKEKEIKNIVYVYY